MLCHIPSSDPFESEKQWSAISEYYVLVLTIFINLKVIGDLTTFCGVYLTMMFLFCYGCRTQNAEERKEIEGILGECLGPRIVHLLYGKL